MEVKKKEILLKRDFETFKSEETKKDIEFFTKSQHNTKKMMLTDDLLFKNDSLIVSPIVFCKKNNYVKEEKMSAKLIIFENLLKVVTQAYYKSEASIGGLIQEIENKSKYSNKLFFYEVLMNKFYILSFLFLY